MNGLNVQVLSQNVPNNAMISKQPAASIVSVTPIALVKTVSHD